MPFKSRHTENLRKGRASVPGAIYFVTWATKGRIPFFADEPNRKLARQHLTAIDGSGDGSIMAGTVMPDHIHLLLEPGTRLPLSAVIAKTKAAITRTGRGAKWQLNFFDHSLRAINSIDDYAFYVFMNPYCAGVCSLNQNWSGWISSQTIRWHFEEKLQEGGFPQPKWIEQTCSFAASLPEGAD